MKAEPAEGRYPRSFHAVWASALALLVTGLVLVYSVSSALALTLPDGDPLFYARKQLETAAVGLVLLVLVFSFDYRRWRKATPFVLAACAALLLLVHLPGLGIEAKGATRWVGVGPISVQPSELVKLAVVLYAAHILARSSVKAHPDDLRAVVVVGLAACGLIVLQRDLGTGVVLAASVMGLLWVAGMSAKQWLLIVSFGAGAVMLAILAAPYRLRRLSSFLDPSVDPLGLGYQIRQGLLALGRGGLFGVGGGKSVQKFTYLPEAHTDMIFAVLGEEYGLLGVGFVVGLFAVFAVAAFQLSRRCADPFGRYLIAGCAFLVYAQALINVGGVMAALPLTGVPLPFISFGRNNLLVVMVAVGVIMSVARWGPAVPVAGEQSLPKRTGETLNVTYLDRGRRYGGARGARAGRR